MSTLQTRLIDAMGERYTAADLVRACNVSHVAVRKWLNGQTKTLKQETCACAAQFLGVRSDWLGSGRGPKTPDLPAQSDAMLDKLIAAMAAFAQPFAELTKVVAEVKAERAKQLAAPTRTAKAKRA